MPEMTVPDLRDVRRQRKLEARLDNWSPRDIVNTLRDSYGIRGQESAVRAAATIIFNHFEYGKPSCSLFTGPTGCGKSEIWRALASEMGKGELIIMLDGSTLQPEGWSGGTHLSNIIRTIDPKNLDHIILVIDEVDKLIKPKIGKGDTDYAAIMQDNLLKIADHDVITYERDGGKAAMLSCEKISLVLLGAFEPIRQTKAKATERRGIGFNNSSESEEKPDTPAITRADLISYGMKNEIAGRIGQIVNMSPLSATDMMRIGYTYIGTLTSTYHTKISISERTMRKLARQALESNLGARYLKSRLDLAVNDCLWDDPFGDKGEFHLVLPSTPYL